MATTDAQGTVTHVRRLSKRDWTIIACGALVLIASFLPWESATSSGDGAVYTGSASAWNAGFGAWFGSLLAAAAAAAVVARHLGHLPGIREIGPNLAVCALAIAALVFLGLRLLTLPHGGTSYGAFGSAGSYGPGFGAFAGVGLAAVQAIVTMLNVRAAGEKIPSFKAPATRPAGPASVPAPGYHQPAGYAPPTVYDQSGGYPKAASYSQPPAYAPPGPGRVSGDVPEAPQPYSDQELARRLTRLDNLRANGMISDAEHVEQRRRIISGL